jgi:hypothetical protein
MSTYYDFFYLSTALLAIHWFCDFVLQTRWQAENKSKNNEALSRHVASYSVAFLAFLFVLQLIGVEFTNTGVILYMIINGGLHWFTDYITSRCTSYFWGKKDIHTFFAVIGIDQLIHSTTLLATVPLLVK